MYLPGVPLEGIDDWIIDFRWKRHIPNNGTHGCKGRPGVSPCGCGTQVAPAPGIPGGLAALIPLSPHGGQGGHRWRLTSSRTPLDLSRDSRSAGLAVIDLTRAVIREVSPRPPVYLVPMNGGGTVDVFLVSVAHQKCRLAGQIKKGTNDEVSFCEGALLGFTEITRRSYVEVLHRPESTVKSAYCCGISGGDHHRKLWRNMREAGSRHAVRLRCFMPEPVRTLISSCRRLEGET